MRMEGVAARNVEMGEKARTAVLRRVQRIFSAERLNLPTMTFNATPPRASRPNEKPAPNSERVMVGNDALFECSYLGAAASDRIATAASCEMGCTPDSRLAMVRRLTPRRAASPACERPSWMRVFLYSNEFISAATAEGSNRYSHVGQKLIDPTIRAINKIHRPIIAVPRLQQASRRLIGDPSGVWPIGLTLDPTPTPNVVDDVVAVVLKDELGSAECVVSAGVAEVNKRCHGSVGFSGWGCGSRRAHRQQKHNAVSAHGPQAKRCRICIFFFRLSNVESIHPHPNHEKQ